MKPKATNPISASAQAATGARADVSIHIERLVIDGLPLTGVQGAQLQSALQRELTRLIASEGKLLLGGTAGTSQAKLTAPAVSVPGPAQPNELGRQIARSVFASLNSTL